MQLSETVTYYNNSLLGYVLMPHHLHALIGLKENRELSRFMHSFKVLSSKKLKQLVNPNVYTALFEGGRYGLWMRRYDDLIIYSERQFQIKLDYIHNNPVKAGLVTKAIDWRYSSAGDWLSGVSGLIPIDKSLSGYW